MDDRGNYSVFSEATNIIKLTKVCKYIMNAWLVYGWCTCECVDGVKIIHRMESTTISDIL